MKKIVLLSSIIIIIILVVIRPLLNQYSYSFYNPKMGRKIFGIGIGRTATSSLSYALMQLGIKTWHAPAMLNRENMVNYTQKFDALTDLWSVTDIGFKELYEMFPNALYILTLRESKSWLNSTKYYKKLGSISKWFPGYKEMQNKIKLLSIKYYEDYNASVIEFFKNKPNKLLIMNIPKGNGWKKLCTCLELDEPLEPFPHISEIYLHFYQCFKYPIP